MSFETLLTDDEEIEMIVKPEKGLMMHANDMFKILAALFFLSISFYVGFIANLIFFKLFGLIVLIMISRAIYIRYYNTVETEYVISNKRVLFLRNKKIIGQKAFSEIEEISYENSGNNTGYIILGKPEELFAGRGISFEEDKYILDNLSNYSEVSGLLKSLHKKP